MSLKNLFVVGSSSLGFCPRCRTVAIGNRAVSAAHLDKRQRSVKDWAGGSERFTEGSTSDEKKFKLTTPTSMI